MDGALSPIVEPLNEGSGAREPSAAADSLIPQPPPTHDHKSFDEAFFAAQREFEEIIRDGYNPGGPNQKSYHYATLPNVIATLRPTLHRHGLHYMQPTDMIDIAGQAMMVVKTQLTFINPKRPKATHTRESIYPVCKGYLPPQTIGTLLTYARRYALLSFMGVAPEEHDDDAASAANVGEAPALPPPAPANDGAEPTSNALRENGEGQWANEAIDKCTTEAELDDLLQGERWNALPRRYRHSFDDKIEVCREMIRNAGGKLKALDAKAERPDGDAVLYADLLRRLNKAKTAKALDAWLELLTDETLRRLTKNQRDSLRADHTKKREALKSGG